MSCAFAVECFREKFPILHKPIQNGKRLLYFDNAATTQKPKCVIDKFVDFYSNYNSNVHRGMYEFSHLATKEYEATRTKVAEYFGLKDAREIIFVRGTTEAINLVANSYGRKFLRTGDEVLVGAAEHHANYLPWQALEQEIGIKRKIIPLGPDLTIDLQEYDKLFSSNTKLVAIQHVSNVIGTRNDIKEMTRIAHAHGAKILVDGACSLALEKLNLRDIGCDFFACSGHKCFGPMGSGILFGKYDILDQMLPYQYGGNMVTHVDFSQSVFKSPPDKFEAGTPDVAAVIALGTTIDFLNTIDWTMAQAHLQMLSRYAYEQLTTLPDVTIYGHPDVSILSFNVSGIHAHDVATYLGSHGVAVRAGNHCAKPLMDIIKIPASVRFSLSLYNTKDEIDIALAILSQCRQKFK